MKKSLIKNMDFNYLSQIGFTGVQVDFICNLVNRVIREKLYINYFPYHDIKHIERVLCYCIWILNMKKSKGEILDNSDILLYAALYHDCGRSFKVSNKMHGIVGSQVARKKLSNTFDSKTLNIIELLIETHAKKENTVDFKNYNFDDTDKKNIQILSDILKDADALDRNRIKLFKFAQCNPSYLRTEEAIEIYKHSDIFYKKYKCTIRK